MLHFYKQIHKDQTLDINAYVVSILTTGARSDRHSPEAHTTTLTLPQSPLNAQAAPYAAATLPIEPLAQTAALTLHQNALSTFLQQQAHTWATLVNTDTPFSLLLFTP